jgi:hypothetical protein
MMMNIRDSVMPVGFIVAVETNRIVGRAPPALAYVATFPNPSDALSAVRKLGGPTEKVKVVAEITPSTVAALGVAQKTVKLL